MDSAITWLSLFASSSTLVCCAFPIIFISLGLGATLASATSNFPFLIILSEHKGYTFGISALILCISAWLMYRPSRVCPTDPKLAASCDTANTWNRRIFWFSVSVWLVGFSFAFLAQPVRMLLSDKTDMPYTAQNSDNQSQSSMSRNIKGMTCAACVISGEKAILQSKHTIQ